MKPYYIVVIGTTVIDLMDQCNSRHLEGYKACGGIVRVVDDKGISLRNQKFNEVYMQTMTYAAES